MRERAILHLSRNNVFTFQTSPMIDVEIIHIPQDVGDWWTFKTLKDGIDFRVNPASTEVIGLEYINEGVAK